jgi:glycosyltransferase involved in cell wall biosynthesis
MNQPPLIVHTDWSRAWGGQEMRVLTELREMKKQGFRVALIVREQAELARRARREDIPVYYIDFSSKFNLAAWFALLVLIRRIRPAVLNTHSSEDSWMAGGVGRLCRVPLMIKTRHVLAPISSSLSYNLFFDVIFACSESIGRQLAAQKVSREKILVQSTGIDEQRFRFSHGQRREIRSRYGIGDDEILVGNVAFIRHYKGHEFIVQTAATMPDNYRFMIVGGGDALPDLEKLIAEAGLTDRFVLTGHQEEPERFFSAIDIIFFSSYEAEGISQSFIQGLLYGIPLLTCRTPSIMEPLEHVQRYRDIDYGDVDAARTALLELSQRLDRDEEKIEIQRRAIIAKYGLQKMVDTIVNTYRKHGIFVAS